MPVLRSKRGHLLLLATLLLATFLLSSLTSPFYSFLNPVNGIWSNTNDGIYPKYSTVKLQGLQAPVIILRDSHGVPHIYAQNELDLYFAWGYVHAQDRLFQMDIFRRLAEGKLSEVIGNTTYETDLFYRGIRLIEYAQETWNALDPSTRFLLQAYAAGVNQEINQTLSNLPMEFKILGYTPALWTPIDTLTFGKFEAWSLSSSFIDLDYAKLLNAFGNETLQQLYPLLPPGEVTIIPPDVSGQMLAAPPPTTSEITAPNLKALKTMQNSIIQLSNWLKKVQIPLFQTQGSNSWVVSGSKTITGKPFLANDPHLPLITPALWYEVHLNINSTGTGVQKLNARGVSFPGIPAIIIGHNDRIAWGLTVFPVDALDLYYYTFNHDQSAYLYQGQYRPVNHTSTIIRVKTGTSITDHQITLNATIHGPLIPMNGTPYAIRWTGQGITLDLLTFYKLSYAKNLNDFKAALQDFQAAQQNFVYADVDGNIAHVGAGRVPIRRTGFGRIPVPGNVSTYEWTGYLPFDQLPQIVNPTDGFIVTANNRPILPKRPFYASFYAEHYRAQRITELLNVSALLGIPDMERIQTDTLSIEARDMVPFIVKAVNIAINLVNTTQLNEHQLAYALSQWDDTMLADEVAPTIFTTWLQHYSTDYWSSLYAQAGVDGPYPRTQTLDYHTQINSTRWFNNTSTLHETRDDVIREAMTQTLTDLKQQLGSDISTWTWGRIHTYQMDHPLGSALNWLNYPRLQANGGENTVNVADGLDVSAGPSFRQIVDLSNPTGSVDIIPGGQSGFRFNPHWDDQLTLWQQGEYKSAPTPTVPLQLRDVESNLTLIPLTPYILYGASQT